jgi:hypothetical protein
MRLPAHHRPVRTLVPSSVKSTSEFPCIRLLKTTGAAREIKALRFSKIVLEILFSIAYHLNEFR